MKQIVLKISEKVMKIVDMRRKKTNKKSSMSWERANKVLKSKYGV